MKFIVNLDHDYKYVTTYPMSKVSSKFEMDQAISKGQVIIGNDVWIGRGATIMDGVIIGNGSIIAANAVVTKNVPPYAIVAGNPAQVVKYRFSDDVIQKVNGLKWWYWDDRNIIKNKDFFCDKEMKSLNTLCETKNKADIKKFYKKNEWEEIEIKYLYIIDNDDPYPLWKKIVSQFVLNFSGNTNCALVLSIENFSNNEKIINEISDILNSNIEETVIYVEQISFDGYEREILSKFNYFITNRNFISLKLIDYANEFDIKVIPGTKSNLFD